MAGPPAPPEISQRDAERLQALPRSERQRVLMERQQATQKAAQQQSDQGQRNRERLGILTRTREQIKANAEHLAAALAELDKLQGLTPEQERQAAWLARYLIDPNVRENSSMEPQPSRRGVPTLLMPDMRM
jgi:acyl-CoA reductase-like NAD-dependent aldehyde dehydrogenase